MTTTIRLVPGQDRDLLAVDDGDGDVSPGELPDALASRTAMAALYRAQDSTGQEPS